MQISRANVHVTKSENLSRTSPIDDGTVYWETGACRRNNRGTTEPNDSNVGRTCGRVGWRAHANCITYFTLPRNRLTLNRLQEAARAGTSLRSRSIGGLSRLQAGPNYWSSALIGKNVSSHSTGQSDSSNRSRGSRGPTVAICHLPLARPPSIATNPSPLKFIDWAVHSSVFRFFFAG